jgi:hypothetical protein
MQRIRNVLGLIAGLLMLASSAAHGILGWRVVWTSLRQLHASPDAIETMALGWRFGSLSMLAFGAILSLIFLSRLRGRNASLMPAVVIGSAYVAFGGWALAVTKDPFFFVFVIPGVLALIATAPTRSA